MTRLVHTLTSFDRARLLAHFVTLSEEDRYLRFGFARDDAALADYVAGIDFARDFVLGIPDAEFRLAAVAHVGILAGTAEVGLSVAPGFRRRNLASALLRRAATRARALGARLLWIRFLRENRAIAALARKSGMRLHLSGAEGDAWLDLPPPAQLTYALDLYESQLAFIVRAWHLFSGAACRAAA